MLRTIFTAMILASVASSVANADPVLWDFTTPLGNLGLTHTFDSSPSGGGSIAATAFGGGDLFIKDDGVGERGIGITPGDDGDNEITPGKFIQFDTDGTVNLVNANFSFEGSSIQVEENAQLFGSNVAGVLGTMLTSLAGTGSAEASTTVDLTGFRYLNVTTTAGDIDVVSLDNATRAVDEPSTLAVLGLALIGFGFLRYGWRGALDPAI